MPAPWSLPYTNEHGVEMYEDTPTVCCDCPFYESTMFTDDGDFWASARCMRALKFPTRKGTCKTKEKAAAHE